MNTAFRIYQRSCTPLLRGTLLRNQKRSAHKLLDQDAVADLFGQYAQKRDGVYSLDCDDIRNLRAGIGEDPRDDNAVEDLFRVADLDGNGVIDLQEFLEHASAFLDSNPARIILVVGGPGSGMLRVILIFVESFMEIRLTLVVALLWIHRKGKFVFEAGGRMQRSSSQ